MNQRALWCGARRFGLDSAEVHSIQATLKTLSVLLGMWLILAMIGLVAGVVPVRSLAIQLGWQPPDEGAQNEVRAAHDVAPNESEEVGATIATPTPTTADGETHAEQPSLVATNGSATTEGSSAAEPEDNARSHHDTPTDAVEAETGPTGTSGNTEIAEPLNPPESTANSTAPATGEPALDRTSAPRATVCPERGVGPSLTAANLAGDARAEIIVGCGTEWAVFAVDDTLGLSRIITIRSPAPERGEEPGTGAPALADVDDDGSVDFVLPYARYGPGGSARGGGLYILPRDQFGGFDAPRALAPIAAVAVISAAIDRGSAYDIAALHLSNPFSRVASEAWIFAGGAAPTRKAVLRVGVGAQALAVLDLNRDGIQDLAVASTNDSRVDLFFGDGTAEFPRRITITSPNAANLATGDLDGDGATDLLIEGSSLSWIAAERETTGSAAPIDTAKTLLNVQAIDLDGDHVAEILGWDFPRLTVLARQEDASWSSRTWLELGNGRFGPRRLLATSLDDDDQPEIVLLGVSDATNPRMLELVVVRGASVPRVLDVSETRAIPDAPLTLRATLPDAG